MRTTTEKALPRESPRRCHECFPEVSPQAFFMRKRFVQSQMSVVDRFLRTQQLPRDRYVDWGLPAEKVVFRGVRAAARAIGARQDDASGTGLRSSANSAT